MNWFRKYFEYFTARAVGTAIEVMPINWAYGFGHIVGFLTYHLDVRHRRVGMKNLESVYGESMTDGERRRFLKKVYDHMGTVMVEMVFTPKIVKKGGWRKIISIEKLNGLEKMLQEKKPVIFVTAHLGNWELAGTTMSVLGYPLHSVARTMDNPLLDKYITDVRQADGKKIIKKHGSIRQMLEILKRGERLGIIADQNTPVDNVFVDFMGRKASVPRGIGALAVKTNALIIPGYTYRDPKTKMHTAIAGKPVEIPKDGTTEEKILKITQEFTTVIERWILEHPEQWLWVHNRWKTRPPEEIKNGK